MSVLRIARNNCSRIQTATLGVTRAPTFGTNFAERQNRSTTIETLGPSGRARDDSLYMDMIIQTSRFQKDPSLHRPKVMGARGICTNSNDHLPSAPPLTPTRRSPVRSLHQESAPPLSPTRRSPVRSLHQAFERARQINTQQTIAKVPPPINTKHVAAEVP